MFSITSNKSIKISKGDDSARFPIFLNMGSELSPIRYELKPDITAIIKSRTIEGVIIDEEKWKKVITKDGLYSFYFKRFYWYLDGKIVNLADYGISYAGQPENEDTISVTYIIDDIEIYFYILEQNQTIENYLVKKVFKRNGQIITWYKNKPQYKDFDDQIINDNGDMELHIDGRDTIDLKHGEYYYVIKAKVIDPDTHKYALNTVTNRLPFYVIDDEFDRSW